MTDTTKLVDHAANREFTDFDKSTKEILSRKIAEKLDTNGYFDKLDHAKGFDLKESSNFEVEVDYACEDERACKKLQRKHKVTMKKGVDDAGGGWPSAIFSGKRENVIAYLIDAGYGDNEAELDYLLESSNFEVEVEIDMAVEPQDLKKTIRSMEKKYNIQMKIINPNGPGGGWPVISITGAKNNVKKYLLTDYAHDPRDIKGLFPEVGI
ncbi:MAG: hypothetical protein J7L15_07620 [Clostridiales bacterium]|nr:hypothetical protein [Clostridiales bacterium]